MRQAERMSGGPDPQGLEAARRFVRNRVFGEEDGKRAAVVRAMTGHPKWLTLLPAAIDPSNTERAVGVFSARSYLDSIGRGLFENGDMIPVVDGDLVLSQKQGRIYCDGDEVGDFRNFKSFPEVIVRGDVWISGLRGLDALDISATGNFKINLCPALQIMRGEVFGHAVIRACGMHALGAGWRCQGALNIFNCRSLELINCEVGGGLTIVGSGLQRTGAAAVVGDGVFISDCDKLAILSGELNGEIVISGKNEDALGSLLKQRPDIRIAPMTAKANHGVCSAAEGLAKRKNLNMARKTAVGGKNLFS